MEDDLDPVFAQALGILNRRPQRQRPPPVAVSSASASSDAIVEADDADAFGLDVVNILNRVPEEHHYEQRSWQLTAHAREQKRQKRLMRERDEAEEGRDNLQLELDADKAESLPSRVKLSPAQHALVKVKISCSGPRKGISRAQNDAAARAATQTAHAIEQIETASLLDVFRGSIGGLAVAGRPLRIHSYLHGWDESSQRVRRLFYTTRLSSGKEVRVRCRFGPMKHQVMMQCGAFIRELVAPSGQILSLEHEPWLCNGAASSSSGRQRTA